MAKNNALKKTREIEENFEDFEGFMDHDCDHHEAAAMMEGLVGVINEQMGLAIELTKLVVDKIGDQNLNEDKIFSIFKKSALVIRDCTPLKQLIEE